jgi:hypothetical protein
VGSYVTLDIGRIELDWGKNRGFRNHSHLFLPEDRTTATYYYADGYQKEKEALVRKCTDAKPRLELLGYSLRNLKQSFQWAVEQATEEAQEISIAYEEFFEAMISVEVKRVKFPEKLDLNLGTLGSTFVSSPEFNRFIDFGKFEKWALAAFLDALDPYLLLRLFIENPANSDQCVVWRYQDIVDGGWTDYERLYCPLPDEQKYLIVTEGSSDTGVIRDTMQLLRPTIVDFFNYIDMEENYPFTGSGNLYRFCQGIAKIGIQNRVVAIYDNDTEGIEKYRRTVQLNLPKQMIVMRLPDLVEFESINCVGPSGNTIENVNGKAVSIECFLDWSKAQTKPRVRWTSFNARTGSYQGELEFKEEFVKNFHRCKNDPTYDTSKLARLLDTIYSACVNTPFCRPPD